MKKVKDGWFEFEIVGDIKPTLRFSPRWSICGRFTRGVSLETEYSNEDWFIAVFDWKDAVLIGLIALVYVPINVLSRMDYWIWTRATPKKMPVGRWVRYGWTEWHYQTSDVVAIVHWDKFTKKWRAQSLNCNVKDPNFGNRVDSSRHNTKQEAMKHCEELRLEGAK